MTKDTTGTFRMVLIALFITALITAQLLAVKILAFDLPVSLPLVGDAIFVPAGVLAYSITFLATDCYTELYGKRNAQALVNIGFGTLLVLLVLVWLAIIAPGAGVNIDPDTFGEVLGPSTNIVIGGFLAYLISQHWDVLAFHHIRSYTEGRLLWVRNIGSTATSQAVDTIVFILIAFVLAPVILGIGEALPISVAVSLIIGQYLAKLIIAIADTPLVYVIVGYARSRNLVETPASTVG